jgi:hypothetical protein
MDWKDIGGKLRRVFGLQAQPTPEPLPPPTDRYLSARELQTLLECVQHIKDITQTNALALKSLSLATPRPLGDAERDFQDAMCAQFRPLGGDPLQNSQMALGTCVTWVAQLSQAHNIAVRNEVVVTPNLALPVRSGSRKFAADIGVMAEGATTAMRGICGSLSAAALFLDIPNIQRIHEEYAEHGAVKNQILEKLTTLLMDATCGVRDASPQQTLSLKKK